MSRILIVDSRYVPFLKNELRGGAETVVRCHIDMFMKDNEVGLFTSADSDLIDGIKVYRSSMISKMSSNISGKEYNKRRIADFSSTVNQFKPDLIVNHDQSNNSITKAIRIGHLAPSITFNHDPLSRAGGIFTFGYLQELGEYCKTGLLVNVSKSSMNEWLDYANSIKAKRFPHIDFSEVFNTWYHNFVCTVNDSPSDPKGYCVLVSRMTESKKVGLALRDFSVSNKKLIVVHPEPRTDEDREYCESLKYTYQSCSNIEFKQNLPRTEVLRYIKEADFVVQVADESYGLVAVEATIYGVPVFLFNSQKDHSVLEAAELGKIIQYKSRSLEENVRHINDLNTNSLSERIEISKKARHYFSIEERRKDFQRLIDEANSRFNSQETNLLG